MEPRFGREEAAALSAYMRAGGWVTEFKKTREFEESIARFTGAREVIVVNNGTVGLSLALLAAGVRPGDEVIVPDLTMIATANAACLIGARPVFADVETSSLVLDPAEIEKRLTPRTRAVIMVSFNGRPGRLDEILSVCRRHDLPLIEDAAQSLGSFHAGKHLGTWGDMGVFSFSSQKIVTTGQGGAIVTNDAGRAATLKRLKDFGRASGGNDIHDFMGYNFKFTDVQAVIGIEQMKKLEKRLKRKKEIYARYARNLKGTESIEWIPTDLKITTPWFIDIYVDDPDSLITCLKARGIGSRRVYPAIHSQKVYGRAESRPVTERYAARGLWLPSSAHLTDREVDRVCDSINEFFGRKK